MCCAAGCCSLVRAREPRYLPMHILYICAWDTEGTNQTRLARLSQTPWLTAATYYNIIQYQQSKGNCIAMQKIWRGRGSAWARKELRPIKSREPANKGLEQGRSRAVKDWKGLDFVSIPVPRGLAKSIDQG